MSSTATDPATGGPSSSGADAPAPTPRPPAPAPTPQPKSHMGGGGPTQGYTLPSRYTLDFGRLNSKYRRVDVQMNIDAQNNLSAAVYDQMVQLTQLELPIERGQFVRMWKTLVLKRVQDIYENEKSQRAEHFVRITRNMLLPAPLSDLLFSLGSFFDPTDGFIYDLIPPDRPPNPPVWWTVDPAILADWILTMNRMSHLFTMKEFPSVREYEGRAILRTAIRDQQGLREVAARTNQVRPADGMIRFVNDELFINGPAFDDCGLRATEPLDIIGIRHDYLRDYCIMSNV